MDDCCYKGNLSTFKNEVNQILGRLFSQYYNITLVGFLDSDGYVLDYQIHSLTTSDMRKKLDDILNKAVDYKLATTRAAKLLGYDTSSETFVRGDSHIVVTYEINNYFLVMVIEMSKPLIEAFDFEKFNEKIELILLELKKKIEGLKSLDRGQE